MKRASQAKITRKKTTKGGDSLAVLTINAPKSGQRFALGTQMVLRFSDQGSGRSIGDADLKKLAKVISETLSASIEVRKASDPAPTDADAFALSAIARARLNADNMIDADLRDAGGTYSFAEAQKLLNVSRQTLSAWAKNRKVLAVKRGSRSIVFPANQFSGSRPIQGLHEVLSAHPSQSSWVLLHFLVRPHTSLSDQSPLAVLLTGDVDRVVRIARRELHHGPA